MRRFTLLCWGLLVVFACSRQDLDLFEDDRSVETVSHEMIVLGKKLEDPYSVSNMTRALEEVYPTRGSRYDVTPTDIYVRFLPADEQEFNRLVRMGIDLVDHPLDYQVLEDGDWYHDPDLEEGEITWQYAVLQKDFILPEDIRHEVLDDCFIPEHHPGTRSDGLDWEKVVRASYRLTGNGNLLEPETRGESSQPSGRITIEDPSFHGGEPIGVSGVKVVCHSFVKFSSCHTDASGYYQIPKSYHSRIRYRLVFQNVKGFNIGFNLILVPASTSALGKGSASGVDVHITSGSDKNLFVRSVVNNACYDYHELCHSSDLDMPAWPSGTRIWILRHIAGSCALMMHQGAVMDLPVVQRYLGQYARLLQTFLPDLLIGTKDGGTYEEIYASVIHECAHASHYRQAGNDFWHPFMAYVLDAYVSGKPAYGDGQGELAGYAEVGGTWADFVEQLVCQKRYGRQIHDKAPDYWLHPGIYHYLHDRGITPADIFSAYVSSCCTMDQVWNHLIGLYPEKENIFNSAFTLYD